MTTLQTLLTLTRQEANLENNNFITDQELTTYLNNSLGEMDDIMVNTYEDYRLSIFQATLNSGNYQIPMPADAYKLRGIDIQGNGGTSVNGAPAWFPLRKFQLVDRGRRNNLTSALTYPFGKVNLAYMWQGENGISIFPETQAQGTYQIWYIPKFKPLLNLSDQLQPAMDSQGWVEYAVVDAAIKCLIKQELDPQAYMQRKEALRVRLIGSMSNRDAGGVDCVANVRQNDMWGGNYGGNFGGFGGGF